MGGPGRGDGMGLVRGFGREGMGCRRGEDGGKRGWREGRVRDRGAWVALAWGLSAVFVFAPKTTGVLPMRYRAWGRALVSIPASIPSCQI